MSQRMREVDASVAWLLARLGDAQLDLQPPAPTRPTGVVSPSPWALQPNALCVSLVEGVRGPVLQALETDAAGQLRHYKVQDPSLTNWFGLAFALRNQGISDFPICNKSFDLSYCGNDL
jgi:Ni,Fe-hydrogenase III large subunit